MNTWEALFCGEIVLFALVGVYCLGEVVRSYVVARLEPGLQKSVGLTYRMRFHILLFAGSATRVCALIVEVMREKTVTNDEGSWTHYVVRDAPSLVFFTSFSLLILFWAKLYYAVMGMYFTYLIPLFLMLNICVYTVYTTLAVVTYATKDYRGFYLYGMIVVAAVYLLGAATFIFYGAKGYQQIKNRTETLETRKTILRRVVVLGVLCTIVLSGRGAYAFAVSVFHIHYYPSPDVHYEWDALVYFAFEFLPSAIVLALTYRHRIQRRLASGEDKPLNVEATRESATLNPLGDEQTLLFEEFEDPDIPMALDRRSPPSYGSMPEDAPPPTDVAPLGVAVDGVQTP